MGAPRLKQAFGAGRGRMPLASIDRHPSPPVSEGKLDYMFGYSRSSSCTCVEQEQSLCSLEQHQKEHDKNCKLVGLGGESPSSEPELEPELEQQCSLIESNCETLGNDHEQTAPICKSAQTPEQISHEPAEPLAELQPKPHLLRGRCSPSPLPVMQQPQICHPGSSGRSRDELKAQAPENLLMTIPTPARAGNTCRPGTTGTNAPVVRNGTSASTISPLQCYAKRVRTPLESGHEQGVPIQKSSPSHRRILVRPAEPLAELQPASHPFQRRPTPAPLPVVDICPLDGGFETKARAITTHLVANPTATHIGSAVAWVQANADTSGCEDLERYDLDKVWKELDELKSLPVVRDGTSCCMCNDPACAIL